VRVVALAGPRKARRREPALIGVSAAIQEIRRAIASAAPTPVTVLLSGETGTGKGLIARIIHERSLRPGEFVHVDCAALSSSVIESELFGHERGAFTGAVRRREGRFALAAGGTLFLDEIGDLQPPLQAKLLRVLEDREYERVGGEQTLHSDARVIAATNRDLCGELREGRFRADLYFRLRVFPICVPPLRERLEDVPLIARRALGELSAQLGLPRPALAPDFVAGLMGHAWPGNVRELLNALECLLVRRAGSELSAADLDDVLQRERLGDLAGGAPAPASPGACGQPGAQPEAQESARIAEALAGAGGNVSRASRRLGISRGRLRGKILKYGLSHMIPHD